MRIWLAAMLIMASGLIGVGRAREEKRRVTALGDLTSGIEMLRSEVCSRGSTMPELARKLSEDAAGRAGELFSALDEQMPRLGEKSFSSLWRSAVMSLKMRPQERQALLRLGSALGRYDAEEQGREMDMCILRLRDIERAAAQRSEQYARLYAGLGFCLGAMAAAILL